MTQDEIISMAREAGFDTDLPSFKDGTAIALKLAALVAEHLIETNKALAKEIIKLKKQLKQKPVAKVVLNRANQITMQKPNGDYFDISKHVGQSFYTAPVSTKFLTDDEIVQLIQRYTIDGNVMPFALCEAVIASYLDKNK